MKFCLLTLPAILFFACIGRAQDSSDSKSAANPLKTETVFRLTLPDGRERLVTKTETALQPKTLGRLSKPIFRAVIAERWPAGLVPLFLVEKTNRFELRRRPAVGQENSSEPLFFALPPDEEPEAGKLAGYWEVEGTRNNSKVFLGWDLAIEGDQVIGRFDQSTEYRFGLITGGTFKSNRLDLRVEYVMDRYTLVGTCDHGKLTGSWQHTDDAERGTWQAERPVVPLPDSTKAVALYEWRRASDDARRYALPDENLPEPWQRVGRPLCRVWKVE
jgi:hypothetical protein